MKKRCDKLILIINIVIYVFLCCNIIFASNIGPGGADIQAAVVPILPRGSDDDASKPRGFKLEGAEFYEYVEYDDHGNIVDKHNIIIGRLEGNFGSGGGSKNKGNNNRNSSGIKSHNGTGNSSTSKTPGQGGTGSQQYTPGKSSNNTDSHEKLMEEMYRESYNESVMMESVINSMNSQPRVAPETVVQDEHYKAPEVESTRIKPTAESKGKETRATMETHKELPSDVFAMPEKVDVVIDKEIVPKIDEIQKEYNDVAVNYNYEGPTVEVTEKQTEEVTEIQTTALPPETTIRVETTEKETVNADELKEGEDNDKKEEPEDGEMLEDHGENDDEGFDEGDGETRVGVKIFELKTNGDVGFKENETVSFNDMQRKVIMGMVGCIFAFGFFKFYAKALVFRFIKRKYII